MSAQKSSIDIAKAYQEASAKVILALQKSHPTSEMQLKYTVKKLLNTCYAQLDALSVKQLRNETESGKTDGAEHLLARLQEIHNGRAFTEKDLAKASGKSVGAIVAAQKQAQSDMQSYRQSRMELRGELKSSINGAYKAVNDKLKELSKTGQNTILRAREEIISTFRDEGVFKVTFSNGAKVDAGAYAAMVARTARAESQTEYHLSIAKDTGTNLVKCIGNSVTCAVCAQYQNRVYCIDGNDKRFPSLYEGQNAPLRHGYKVIHPNCRCEFIPYYAEMQTPEQLQNDIRQSNRPWKDSRTMRQKNDYQAWQAKNRQYRDELNEYYAMKNTLGNDMPYKTIGSFRRAVRSDDLPPNIKKFRYKKRDNAQYARWKKILGNGEMPDTLDKFQELKYNKTEQYEALKARKENAYLDMPYDEVIDKVGLLSNQKVRMWYNKNVHDIGNQIDTSKPLEFQARQAFELRNHYKMQARNLMVDEKMKNELNEREKPKTFEFLVEKYKKELKTQDMDRVYKAIIDSSTRTNKKVNKILNVEV